MKGSGILYEKLKEETKSLISVYDNLGSICDDGLMKVSTNKGR